MIHHANHCRIDTIDKTGGCSRLQPLSGSMENTWSFFSLFFALSVLAGRPFLQQSINFSTASFTWSRVSCG